MYEIVVSPTFKLCLNRLIQFLEVKYSVEKAHQTKVLLKQSISTQLCKDPYIAPVSGRLIELGITDYRKELIDKHNVVFYRINEKNKQVILLAVMDTRQSIQKLLHEVMLLS